MSAPQAEVILSPAEFRELVAILERPARVIPELAEMIRRVRARREAVL